MHRSRAVISSFLASLLIVISVSPAFAVSRQDYLDHRNAADAARQKAAAAEKTANALAAQVAALDKEIDTFESQASALEPKIAKATARTQRILQEVQRLSSEVASVQQQIEDTQAEYVHQQELLSDRVESTYRQGQWFYLDLLLGSTDIGDLIKRTEFVSRVIDSNNDLAAGLENTERSLSKSKVQLDRTLASVKIKKREAAQVESSLRSLRRQKKHAADQREAVQAQKSELVAENKANAARLRKLAEEEEAESARIAAELSRAGRGSGLYAGTMSWPVPASTRISSYFGWRVHPIFGVRKFHTGIDISGQGGTPAIVAAGSGDVIYAGYRGGYGNTVMIDHGNGVVTLYAHMSSFSTYYGASVREGQKIGNVGSTGNSTGPHLHFEVRVNGEPTNPLDYL